MSEHSLWNEMNDYIPEEIHVEKVTNQTQKKSIYKILKILVCTLFAVLFIEAIAYFVVIPNTTACTVSFTGLQSLEANELGSTLAQACGTNWLTFDTSAAASRILSYSAVEGVSVQKRFPNKIVIDITERTPVALTLATVNERTIPALIDENGVVFNMSNKESYQSLPLISGLGIESFYDGMRINNKYYSLLKQVALIQKNNADYFKVISEIAIEPKEFDNYELIIFPVHTKTKVLVDRSFTEDALKYMMVALDVVKSLSQSVTELDLRYGTVSYKMGI